MYNSSISLLAGDGLCAGISDILPAPSVDHRRLCRIAQYSAHSARADQLLPLHQLISNGVFFSLSASRLAKSENCRCDVGGSNSLHRRLHARESVEVRVSTSTDNALPCDTSTSRLWVNLTDGLKRLHHSPVLLPPAVATLDSLI
jgi:hypothetical protein